MPIYQKALAFIARPDPAQLQALALDIFRHQFETVASYRDYCLSIGLHPEDARTVDDIPAVSTLAFKHARLAGAEEGPDARTFMTSGTTIGRGQRGSHVVTHPEIYRASAISHLQCMLFPDGSRMRMLTMHPTADRMPESSLSQMISWCVEEFGAERVLCAADRKGIEPNGACEFLAEAQLDQAAVCILGTTASLGALFAHMDQRGIRFKLALGSRMMDTGGAKGQSVPLDTKAVCAHAARLLGVESALVINEYGMTELCSQLYDATSFNSDEDARATDRVKIAPPWLSAAAVDPVTLKPVAPGELGMLRFFDLANVGSVSAILTEDFGIVSGNRVRVIGRAGKTEPRGCALAIEQFETAELGRSHHPGSVGLARP